MHEWIQGRAVRVAVAIALATIGLAAGPQAQDAPDLVISSGNEEGSYHAMAGRLSAQLRSRGRYAEVRTSRGSVENLVRLKDPDSPVSVAFTQADALVGYTELHEGGFEVLADVGKECIFLIARRGSGIRTARDLKTYTRKLSVNQPGSGANLTWHVLQGIEPAFAATVPVTIDIMEALAQLRAPAAYARIDAAMVVQRPRLVSPALEVVLSNPDLYILVPIRAGDVRHARLPDGRPVYSREIVKVRYVQVETLCTRALVVVNPQKIGSEVRGDLARVLLEDARYIAPGAGS